MENVACIYTYYYTHRKRNIQVIFFDESFTLKYSRPLNNVGIRRANSLCSWKSVYTFGLPPNLTANMC